MKLVSGCFSCLAVGLLVAGMLVLAATFGFYHLVGGTG